MWQLGKMVHNSITATFGSFSTNPFSSTDLFRASRIHTCANAHMYARARQKIFEQVVAGAATANAVLAPAITILRLQGRPELAPRATEADHHFINPLSLRAGSARGGVHSRERPRTRPSLELTTSPGAYRLWGSRGFIKYRPKRSLRSSRTDLGRWSLRPFGLADPLPRGFASS